MQSSVLAFIVINVDGDFLDQTQRLAVGGFVTLKVGPENVVGFAGENALGELAIVIGIELPLGFLILGTADLHGHAVDGMVVRPPDRPKDQCVGLFRLGVMLRGTWAGADYQKNEQEGDQGKREGIRPCGVRAQAESMSSHRLRFPPPRLRLPRRSRLPPLSVRADW